MAVWETHPTSPPRRLLCSLTCAALKAVIVTSCFVIAWGLFTLARHTDPGPGSAPAEPLGTRLETLMVRHTCSRTGFEHRVPASALLLTPAGNVRHVSFARGWASHQGERPGTLLAVCLAPLR